jgi:hypothetical protein
MAGHAIALHSRRIDMEIPLAVPAAVNAHSELLRLGGIERRRNE